MAPTRVARSAAAAVVVLLQQEPHPPPPTPFVRSVVASNNRIVLTPVLTTRAVTLQAGIVEKLLPSYGFIQCCERQARLFFHYSQFNGNIEHLKLGDPVEFEMTYDRRTGKPIASTVAKISNEVFPNDDVTNPDQVRIYILPVCRATCIAIANCCLSWQPGQVANGFITTEPLPGKDGRVAYENRGECFFLPFTLDDVEPVGTAVRTNHMS